MIRVCLVALAMGVTSASAEGEVSFARYHGTVEARDLDTLTIRRDAGEPVTLLMNRKTRMLIATTGRIRDIKPESYLSIVSVPGPDGKRVPIKVAIYSPSERGFEAGTKPWSAAPDATLTAGWIGDLSIDTPRRVELVYDGGAERFTIPPGTPTTQIAPGEKALLVPGADVVVFVRIDAQGLVNADLVAVGRQGITPAL